MNEKLLNILTKINLRKAYFAYFENASFSSLSYNPQKKRYNIVISSLQPLLAPVYVETLNAFTKYLSSQDNEVTVSLSIKLEKEGELNFCPSKVNATFNERVFNLDNILSPSSFLLSSFNSISSIL